MTKRTVRSTVSNASNVVSLEIETRTRMMLADMSTWPNGWRLSVKQLPYRSLDDSFGLIYDTELPIVIYPYKGSVAPWAYDTIDELIADGWVVD